MGPASTTPHQPKSPLSNNSPNQTPPNLDGRDFAQAKILSMEQQAQAAAASWLGMGPPAFTSMQALQNLGRMSPPPLQAKPQTAMVAAPPPTTTEKNERL